MRNRSTKKRNKKIMEISTAQTRAKYFSTLGNWLAWLDNPSKTDLEWLEASKKRDMAVGAVLQEMHSLASSNRHPQQVDGQTDESFWTGYAMNCPGYELDKLKAELAKRKTAFSTAVPLKA